MTKLFKTLTLLLGVATGLLLAGCGSTAKKPSSEASLQKPLSFFPTPGFSEQSHWRFSYQCGRQPNVGFLTITGLEASGAVSAHFSEYPFSQRAYFGAKNSYQVLLMEGQFDAATGQLKLITVGDKEYQEKKVNVGVTVKKPIPFGPVELNLALSPDGLKLEGSHRGKRECSSLTGLKYVKDPRPNVVRSHTTKEACTQLVEWAMTNESTKLAGKSVPSLLLDLDGLYQHLGYTIEVYSLPRRYTTEKSTRKCFSLLAKSMDVDDAELLKKYRAKSKRSSPFAQLGYALGNNPNDFAAFYYELIGKRESADKVNKMLAQIDRLPIALDSLSTLKQMSKERPDVSKSMREGLNSAIKAKQHEIVSHHVSPRLKKPLVDSRQSLPDQLKAISNKIDTASKGVDQLVSQSIVASVLSPLSKKKEEISGQYVSQLIKEFDYPVSDLAQLIEFKSKISNKSIYTQKLKDTLVTDRAHFQAFLQTIYKQKLESVSATAPAWLEKNISSDEKGKQKLSQLSQSLFGVDTGKLKETRVEPNLRALRQNFIDRFEQLKKDKCEVPVGFEHMRETLCS